MQDIVKNLTKQINRAKKPITILFTDIEASTQYWAKHGDVEGRLMVDRHNRLMFPIIKRFNGKVVKTIGDSIMASFKYPEDAVQAAVGMQQFLEKTRAESDVHVPNIRIGIHTGEGIVENKDVFGDVVNVASRVESEAAGGEILVSGKTASAIGRIKQYRLTKKGKFTPKGKSQAINLFRCDWDDYTDLTGEFKVDTLTLLVAQQKLPVLLYATGICGFLYFIFNEYLRFLMADKQEYALIFLNPQLFFETYGLYLAGFSLTAIFVLIFLAWNERLSHLIMRLLRGSFGFCIGFFLFYVPTQFWPTDIDKYWSAALYESKHLFVEVLENESPIHQQAKVNSPLLKTVDKGTLLLLANTTKRHGYVWNKVLIDTGKYGWIERVTPPRLGVESKRLTIANKFYFRYKDAYALLCGVLGFFWGLLSFRIKTF